MEELDYFYQYRLLDPGHIRLLEIERSSNRGDSVSCHLAHRNLESLDDVVVEGSKRKAYTTLSYAWGAIASDGSHLTDLIFVDHAPLRITAQLNQALLRVRQVHLHVLVLWVDAVCIDQRNTTERNQQVSMMQDIYSKSHHTVVWLGEYDSDNDAAIFAFSCDRMKWLKDPALEN